MKFKNILIIIIINYIFIIVLLIFGILITQNEALQTIEFHPVADSYVSDMHPDENYGNETIVCATNQSLIVYLKFDISSIPTDDYVDLAQLNLKVEELKSGIIIWERFYPNSVNAYYTTHVEWNENDINWNNKPEFNPDVIDYDDVSKDEDWSDWDITEVARENRIFTIVLKNADIRTQFYSRESVYPPTLEVSFIEQSTYNLIQMGEDILSWLIIGGFFAALLGGLYHIRRKKRKLKVKKNI